MKLAQQPQLVFEDGVFLKEQSSRIKSNEKNIRSPFIVPLELERFVKPFKTKLAEGLFFEEEPHGAPSQVRAALKNVRMSGKWLLLHSGISLKPSEGTLEKTRETARVFFSLTYEYLLEKNEIFPLAGRNKCLGMAVVPKTKLVLIALSQDRFPKNDKQLRDKLLILIDGVNKLTKRWVFELVRLPTPAEYILLRTLTMRSPHQPPDEWVSPPTRCVEVALMVALCKVGRFFSMLPKEIGAVAFGATLWNSPKGTQAVVNFNGAVRNMKHTKQDPIEVLLPDDKIGYLDVWEPCPTHCARYEDAMRSLSVAGGLSSSFIEPRAEYRSFSSH